MGAPIVSFGTEEREWGVKLGEIRGAAVGAEGLSPRLCSVMGNTEYRRFQRPDLSEEEEEGGRTPFSSEKKTL